MFDFMWLCVYTIYMYVCVCVCVGGGTGYAYLTVFVTLSIPRFVPVEDISDFY